MPLQGPLPFTTIFVDHFKLPSNLRTAGGPVDRPGKTRRRLRLNGGHLGGDVRDRGFSASGSKPCWASAFGFEEKQKDALPRTGTGFTEEPRISPDDIPGQAQQDARPQMTEHGSSPAACRFNFYADRPWVYFLSHFHADHIRGLYRNWREGCIFCSEITRKLLLLRLPSLRNVCVALELNQVHTLVFHTSGKEERDGEKKRRRVEEDCRQACAGSGRELCQDTRAERKEGEQTPSCRDGEGLDGEKQTEDGDGSTEESSEDRDEDVEGVVVRVVLLDAHHCPGSVMLVLHSAAFGVYVHTGDFGCSTSDVLERMTQDVKNAIQKLRSAVWSRAKGFNTPNSEGRVLKFVAEEAGSAGSSSPCSRGTASTNSDGAPLLSFPSSSPTKEASQPGVLVARQSASADHKVRRSNQEAAHSRHMLPCSDTTGPSSSMRPEARRERTAPLTRADGMTAQKCVVEQGGAWGIDHLFLDNTYLHPAYEFSSSLESYSKLLEWIRTLRSLLLLSKGRRSGPGTRGNQRDFHSSSTRSSPSLWVVVGVDSLGKEELLVSLATHMSTPVEVPVARFAAIQVALGSEAASRYFRAGLPLDLERALLCRHSAADRVPAAAPPEDSAPHFVGSRACCPCTPCALVSDRRCRFCEPSRDKGGVVGGREETEQKEHLRTRGEERGKSERREEEARQGNVEDCRRDDEGVEEPEEGEVEEGSPDAGKSEVTATAREGDVESQTWEEDEIDRAGAQRQGGISSHGCCSSESKHEPTLRIFAVSRHALTRCVSCLYRQRQAASYDCFYGRRATDLSHRRRRRADEGALLSRLVVGVFCSGWVARCNSRTEGGASCSSPAFPPSVATSSSLSAGPRSRHPIDRPHGKSGPPYFCLLYSSHADFFHLCRFTLSLCPRAVSLLSPVPCPYSRIARADTGGMSSVPWLPREQLLSCRPRALSTASSEKASSSSCSVELLRDVVFPFSTDWFPSSEQDVFSREQTLVPGFAKLLPLSAHASGCAGRSLLAPSSSHSSASLLSSSHRSSWCRPALSTPSEFFEYDGDEGLELFMEACGLSSVVLAAGRTCLLPRRSRLLSSANKTVREDPSLEAQALGSSCRSCQQKDLRLRRSQRELLCPRHGHLVSAVLHGAWPSTEPCRGGGPEQEAGGLSRAAKALGGSGRTGADASSSLFECRVQANFSPEDQAESQAFVEAAYRRCSPLLDCNGHRQCPERSTASASQDGAGGTFSTISEQKEETERLECQFRDSDVENPTISIPGSAVEGVRLPFGTDPCVWSNEAKPGGGESGPLSAVLVDPPRIVVQRNCGTLGGLRRRRQ